MNTSIEAYFTEGCGRCPLGGTPDCKVHTYASILAGLREIIVSTGIKEEVKWGMPCYTWNEKNVLMLAAFKEFVSISFFKGVLLGDPYSILHLAGENSQSSKSIKYTQYSEVNKWKNALVEYIFEAIQLEIEGAKVQFKSLEDYSIPEELNVAFASNIKLREAFMGLSPGRQRGYLLHFSAPKQSKTRIDRIEKYTQRILEGKGFHDRD